MSPNWPKIWRHQGTINSRDLINFIAGSKYNHNIVQLFDLLAALIQLHFTPLGYLANLLPYVQHGHACDLTGLWNWVASTMHYWSLRTVESQQRRSPTMMLSHKWQIHSKPKSRKWIHVKTTSLWVRWKNYYDSPKKRCSILCVTRQLWRIWKRSKHAVWLIPDMFAAHDEWQAHSNWISGTISLCVHLTTFFSTMHLRSVTISVVTTTRGFHFASFGKERLYRYT